MLLPLQAAGVLPHTQHLLTQHPLCPPPPPPPPPGVSQALDLACHMLASPGDTILVEAPTYFLAKGIFESARWGAGVGGWGGGGLGA